MTKATRRAATAPPKPSKPSPPSPEPSLSKLDRLVALLRRPEGATIVQMQEATGWLAHSVRGALAGSLKARLAVPIVSIKTDGVRVYRAGEGAEQ